MFKQNVKHQLNYNITTSKFRTWIRLSPEGVKSEAFAINYGDIIKIGSTVFVS